MAEERVDVHAAVNVSLSTRGSSMRATGLVFLAIGALALVVGSVAFLLAFPEKWYSGTAEANTMVRVAVMGFGIGVVCVMFGFTSLAFARTVIGTGGTDHFEAEPTLEHEGTLAQPAREPWLADPGEDTWPEEAPAEAWHEPEAGTWNEADAWSEPDTGNESDAWPAWEDEKNA